MPVPSQGHCGFPSSSVVDWFCLFFDLWVLPFSLEDCSVFGNFVITLIMWVFILLYIVLSLYDHCIGFICSFNLIWKRNLQNKSNWVHGSGYLPGWTVDIQLLSKSFFHSKQKKKVVSVFLNLFWRWYSTLHTNNTLVDTEQCIYQLFRNSGMVHLYLVMLVMSLINFQRMISCNPP